MAYLFVFPLVMRYRRMFRQAVDSGSPVFSGGFGTWLEHHRIEDRQRGSGRPREDVVYSSTWLDLRAEPWWCSVGEVPTDVSFVGRFADLWGFPLGQLDVDRPGPVLASAPRRVRNVPAQIRSIARGESSVVELSTETRWSDPFRLPGNAPSRPDIVLEPMSVHVGRSAKPPPGPVRWVPWFDGLETTDEFWSYANFALSLITPNDDDRHILDQIATIGVAPGAPWSPVGFPRVVIEAIHDGMDDALNDLLTAAADRNVVRSQPVGRAGMNRDYFARAVAALDIVPGAQW